MHLATHASHAMLAPIARRDIRSISYLEFVRDYALPGVPLVLTGVGADWSAARAACTLAVALALRAPVAWQCS